jgi:SAM-dependent methyltransferase
VEIINPEVKRDIERGNYIRLDLGGGGAGRKGFYSLDNLKLDGVDIIADLNEPLDLIPDDCVEYIYTRHAMEHVSGFLPLMKEIHRIVKKDGIVEIVVPHFSNVYGYSDPTHVRFFGLYSMYYFCDPHDQPATRRLPSYYTDARFRVDSVQIEFYRNSILEKMLAPLISRLVNGSIYRQDFYERRLCHFFHAWQIRYMIRAVK